jgi:phosphoribosylanthranilate isomerase
MWIKICGMTTPEALAAALEAQVDAIGFVFAESPRRLTPQSAVALAAAARGRVSCVAVTRHPEQAALDEILGVFAPDLLQTDAADFETLRVPDSLGRLPVLRAGGALPARLPARVLFEGPASGTGVRVDWSAARALALRTELVLAGGLTCGNVAAAIAAVRPIGVDVSSGVEARRGVKSAAAIMSFVSAVRAAAAAPAAHATGDLS